MRSSPNGHLPWTVPCSNRGCDKVTSHVSVYGGVNESDSGKSSIWLIVLHM